MGKLFTANRVAAIATWLAALGGLVAAFQGVFPAGWQNASVAAVALLTKAVVTLKFLQGAQKSEALQAPVPLWPTTALARQIAANQEQAIVIQGGGGAVVPTYNPDPNFNPVSALAPQREDEAARSPSNPEVPS